MLGRLFSFRACGNGYDHLGMPKEYKMPADMVEFLTDHPMAVAVIHGDIKRMMKTSATMRDDPKQMKKLCSECNGFDGEHKNTWNGPCRRTR